MSDQPKSFFDVWFIAANSVMKEVPYHVVTDWVQQTKLSAEDRVKPSGTADWFKLGSLAAFQPYFVQPDFHRANDAAEAMAPVEMDFDWKPTSGEEDDDVDMIPLIDISLVLLIFFMMTATVSQMSRITVPDMAHAHTIGTNPDVLRIDIDLVGGNRVFALGVGTSAPAPEDDNLSSDVQVIQRLDERLRSATDPPKIRIAAHGDIPYEIVEEVLKQLERRRERNQIRDYAVEVNERATR